MQEEAVVQETIELEQPGLPESQNTDFAGLSSAVSQAPLTAQSDPLLALLSDADNKPNPLLAVEADPLRNRLLLRVSAPLWRRWSVRLRQERADTWRQKAFDLGYQSVWLTDAEEHLLARSVRVGDGMIVFDVETSELEAA